MPKKLNVNANQRVDIPDYLRGANDYTQESDAFLRRKILQAKRALILEGFRLEIPDQTTNPGQVTLYNGNALDRDGEHLNNEDQVNDSRTIILSGGSTTFYLEIEFTENESDTDARAFWDPTFVNAGDIPPGREFTINVATRLSPDWQIVQPVSTSGFAVDTNPSSPRIPIAVLTTNASNEILAGTNPGFVQVVVSSKLEYDIAAAETELRLIDTRMFPDTGTVTVDFGDASAEAGVNFTANDRTNGILTIAPGVASAHLAGAIVRLTGVTPRFLQERTDGEVSTGHPDRRRRMFSGDEIRGGALIKSKETFGSRDDLDIASLKDHIDTMAAQIREMKFGGFRPDYFDSNAPPQQQTDWALRRWHEYGGHLQGARSHSVTIGDGSDSLGDLNELTGEYGFAVAEDLDVLLQQAHDSFAGNGGTIYVKKGSYTWDGTLTLNSTVEIIFEPGCTVSVGANTMIDIAGGKATIRGLYINGGAGDRNVVVSSSFVEVYMYDCFNLGGFDATAATSANSLYIFMENCTWFAENGAAALAFYDQANTLKTSGQFNPEANIFRNCVFQQDDAGQIAITGAMQNCIFDTCAINTVGVGCRLIVVTKGGGTWDMENVLFNKCTFFSSSAEEPILLAPDYIDDVHFVECDFRDVTVDCSLGFGFRAMITIDPVAATFIKGDVGFHGCKFNRETGSTFTNAASDGARARWIYTDGRFARLLVEDCQFGSQRSPGGVSEYRVALEIGDSSLHNCIFRNNDVRYFYHGVRGSCEKFYVVDNRFINESGSVTIPDRDDVAVSAYGSLGSVFVGNYIYMDYNVVPSGFSKTGFSLAATGDYVIANNNIGYLGSNAGSFEADVYGIRFESTGTLYATITGNLFQSIESQGLNFASVHGIYLESTNNSPMRISISGNFFNMFTGGSFDKSCVTVDSTSGSSNITIANNAMRLTSTSGSDWRCVDLSAANAVLSGNSIQNGSSVGMSSLSLASAVYVSEPGCQIIGNAIDMDSIDNGALGIQIVDGENLLIEGNTLYGGSNQDNIMIAITDGFGDIACPGMRIMNNVIELNNADPANFAIYGDLTSGAGTAADIIIQGNVIRETVFGAGRQFVRLDGLGGANCLVFSDNVLEGDFTVAHRTGGPCIELSDMAIVSVNGNIVYNYATSANQGSAIELNAVDVAVVGDNIFLSGDGSVGFETMRFINCDDIVYDGNIYGASAAGFTGTVDTTGSVGIAAGTNKSS